MLITEKYARIDLACNYDVTPRKLMFLLSEYKNAENIISDIGRLVKNNFIKENAKKYDVHCIDIERVMVYGEKIYPNYLANIPDPPIAIFFKGEILNIDFERTIGLVGTRKMSKYGIEVTAKLVRFLVENGYIIVSGLAYGIDSLAHELTLSNGGQTIAVLGTSVNDPYPQSNTWLYKKIIENNGMIISESFFKQEYGKWMFPKRNRIIAGLCKKTIVIEAPQKSGALITANYAFDFDRDVFAVPGPIYSDNCKGTNLLIKNNKAQILTCFEDLLDQEQLQLWKDRHKKPVILNNLIKEEHKFVYNLINNGANNFELLLQKCNYEKSILFEIVSYLELYDLIEKYEDGTFMIK